MVQAKNNYTNKDAPTLTDTWGNINKMCSIRYLLYTWNNFNMICHT